MTRWYYNKRLCAAIFYAIDDLIFEITMRMRFLEASKNIIETPWTLENWDSPWALWIDTFGLSDYAPITLRKREIQQTDAQTVVFGTLEDTDTNCKPGYFTTFLTQAGYAPWDKWWEGRVDSMIDYLWTNYDSKLASGKLLEL